MFNLNVPPSSLLGIEGSGLCYTPKTPEIVNSLIAMTNPLDSYNFSSSASTPCSAVSVRHFIAGPNAQISQDSSHSSSSTSPLDTPVGINSTPSVQQTCSQLIKAGLKLSIQSKRKLSTCDSSSGSEQPNSKCSRRGDEDCDDSTDDDSEHKLTAKGLTPEDEDRRRRRRERNKIAATKCRMKKRERTQNLIRESEQLDTQNVDLKSQVRSLETERRKLHEMLQAHAPTCVRRGGFSFPSKLLQSPALKYLADLELDGGYGLASCDTTPTSTPTSGASCGSTGSSGHDLIAAQSKQQQQQSAAPPQQQRTAIPPMSTIKFSRSNGFKAAAIAQQRHPSPSASPAASLHQQLPNGYCKASPTPQELGYLNSPSQESASLALLQASHVLPVHQSPVSVAVAAVGGSGADLSDYIPNCDSDALSLALAGGNVVGGATLNGGDTSALLASAAAASATSEFVKNELVDSHSPYTTAQSAERFLFESNCESYVDMKHAVSVHPSCGHNLSVVLNGGHHGNNNNNNNHSHINHNTLDGGGGVGSGGGGGGCGGVGNNNNNSHSHSNLLDFHCTSLLGGGGVGGGIVSFHEQASIKNDYLHDADLLAQLAVDGGEFVDLDTGVAATFIANGGCLA